MASPVYYRLFDGKGPVNAQCKDANTSTDDMGVIDINNIPPMARMTYGGIKGAINAQESLVYVVTPQNPLLFTLSPSPGGSGATIPILENDRGPFPPFVGTVKFPLQIQVQGVLPARKLVTAPTSATPSTTPLTVPQPTPTNPTVPAPPPPPYTPSAPTKPANDPTKFTGITWTCSVPSTQKHVHFISDATMTFKPSGNSIDRGTLTIVFSADPQRKKKKGPDPSPETKQYALSQVSFKSPTVIEYTCKGITTNEHWTLSASLSADGTTLTVNQVQAFGNTRDTKTRLYTSQ